MSHSDEFMAKLYAEEATVGDLLDHAQEHIVEQPAMYGTATTEAVRFLIMIIDALCEPSHFEVQQHTNLRELEREVTR